MEHETVIADARTATSTVELGALLRQLRTRQARRRRAPVLTYRELAARTGWSHGIVGAYLAGKVLPPVDRFDELLRQLDASPAECGALATARDRLDDARRARAADALRPRQLPAAITPLVGRACALAALDEQRGRGPAVVSASGGAGAGKTALAVHWAHRVAEEFPDGQLYADLLGCAAGRRPQDPADVLAGFLHSLGVPNSHLPSELDGQVRLYRSVLARRRILVLLDDAKDAEQVRPLLPGRPQCQALITSRTSLTGIVAVEGAKLIMLSPLSRWHAWHLLAVRLGHRRLAGDPAAVETIITGCNGSPLAVAMVAAIAAARPELALRRIAGQLAAGMFPAPDGWDRVTEICGTGPDHAATRA